MKLIDEIVEMLSSDERKLTDALFKTKVLLHKIGHKELIEWVNHELNGYPEEEAVPPYRILPAQVLANASNGAWQLTSHPIPLAHLEKDYRNALESAKMDQPLAVLEKFTEKDTGHLQRTIPMEANGLLGKGMGNGYHISSAWCDIQVSGVIQILTQVRSRLLDFVLELSEKFAGELNEDEVKERGSAFDAENLFNNTIFGDNTTIVVGSSNKQNVKNTNLKGDFNALKSTLQSNGVSEGDIQLLDDAIKEDERTLDKNENEFGPAVKSWLQSMLSKAVDASWQIELGVASSLLATALNNYYG
ncbi:MAG: hypothetical protein WC856_05515 [Methylococcaceae bacterium]|jgi:hypothetical protein